MSFSLAKSPVTSCMLIPNRALWTIPYLRISSTTFRAILEGTANEYPSYEPVRVAMAVLMPTNSPLTFTKAPPELPGFTAASVCMKASILNSSL